jgi:hypothetical protein
MPGTFILATPLHVANFSIEDIVYPISEFCREAFGRFLLEDNLTMADIAKNWG